MIESIWNLSKCKVLCQLLWCVSQVSTSGCTENALLSCIKLMLTQHQRFDLNQQHYKHLGSQTWSNKNSRLYTGSMPQEQKVILLHQSLAGIKKQLLLSHSKLSSNQLIYHLAALFVSLVSSSTPFAESKCTALECQECFTHFQTFAHNLIFYPGGRAANGTYNLSRISTSSSVSVWTLQCQRILKQFKLWL